MTEPTDAEIADVARKAGLLPDNSHPAPETRATRRQTDAVQAFARAVLAKWGTPAPVGVESVAIYHGRCTIDCGEHGHLDMELLKMIPAGSKLYTTPQPTQTLQPAEREPLTDAQIKGLIEEGVFFGNCKEIVRAIEAAHGISIKGGQHVE